MRELETSGAMLRHAAMCTARLRSPPTDCGLEDG